ncbi:hypothetical protein LSA02_14590 [Latilactobacillus sakei subsp. sakei]|nr:hypothetical protein LACBS_00888 [Latilactobacillus sakei subsp. sakei DSM 20017 = JCM 1157]GEL36724.1 hypothetical protein LSA02_14590 [Latilactobacillus sakei subsp. sakei]
MSTSLIRRITDEIGDLTDVARRRKLPIKSTFKIKSATLTGTFEHLPSVVNNRCNRLFAIRSKAQKVVNESTFKKAV